MNEASKIVLIFLVCLMKATWGETPEWTKQAFTSDQENHFYMGVSDGQRNLKLAMEEAYHEAVKEAVRHNYGFNHQLVQNYFATLKNVDMTESMVVRQENINLKGIVPIKENIIRKKNGTYTVFRQIKYPIVEITKEKERLLLLNTPKENTYSLQGKNNGDLMVKTIPMGAQIILTRLDGQGQVTGSGDAKFHLPLGRYQMTIIKRGFEPTSKTIIISGRGLKINEQLKASRGFIIVRPRPQDASVFINNRKVKGNKKLSLQVETDYRLRIEHPDYHSFEKIVSPWINEELIIEKSLEPKLGVISIMTRPDGAVVSIDGEVIGKTPLIGHSLIPGDHNLSINLVGHSTIKRNISVLPNKVNRPMIITLKKETKKERERKEKSRGPSWVKRAWDYVFCSEKEQRFRVSYTPLVYENDDSFYHVVPLSADWHILGKLSLGADVHFMYDEDGNSYSPNTRTITHLSSNAKLWPFRNNHLGLGLGMEINYRHEESRNKLSGTNAKEIIAAESSGTGIMATLLLPLSSKKTFGIHIDYKKLHRKNANSDFTAVGIYFEF